MQKRHGMRYRYVDVLFLLFYLRNKMTISMETACDIAKRYYSGWYKITPTEVLGLYTKIQEKTYITDETHAYELFERYMHNVSRPKISYPHD
jgi:hypothetical protein